MAKCEICKKIKIIETHHIQSKSKGGSNYNVNKAKICATCHKLVHVGLLILEGRFPSTKGDIVVWRKLNEETVTGFKDPEVYIIPNTEYIRKNYLQKYK